MVRLLHEQLAGGQRPIVAFQLSLYAIGKHYLGTRAVVKVYLHLLFDGGKGEVPMTPLHHEVEIRDFSLGCGVPLPLEPIDLIGMQQCTMMALMVDFHLALQHRNHSVHSLQFGEGGLFF